MIITATDTGAGKAMASDGDQIASINFSVRQASLPVLRVPHAGIPQGAFCQYVWLCS